MGKGYKEESMDEKKRKKFKRYERRSKWSVINTDQNLVDWSRQKEREREREREQYLLGYMEYQYSPITGLVPLIKAQGILSRRSWKPGQEIELSRFPRSAENEDRKKATGDPGLEWSKGILLAEIQAYISLVKWLLRHYKEWNSIRCNKMDNLIYLSPLTLKSLKGVN